MPFIEQVKRSAGQLLGVPEQSLLAVELTSRFAWVSSGRIAWVRADRISLVLLVDADGTRRLNTPGDTSVLAGLLRRDAGPLPTRLSAAELAEAIRRLGRDPPGQLGSPTFLAREGSDGGLWCRGRDADCAERFRTGCAAPEIRSAPTNRWQLRFFFFNPLGGLEQWTAAGDRGSLSTSMSLTYPNGTFIVPNA